MGALFPTFRGTKEGQSVILVLAVSQVTLIQNNQYATLAYIGVACPKPHQPCSPPIGILHLTSSYINAEFPNTR